MKQPSQNRALWTAIVAVPVLLAAIAFVQTRIDSQAGSASLQREDLLLRSPSAIQKMSLGYDPLLADVYWTRAVQYYGARFGKKGSTFGLLWPLLDISTTLDPKLIIAYRFGAIFLSESGTAGAGRPDLAVELVKRGIAANPNDWHLDSDLGFLYYWRLRDYAAASDAYLRGSKKRNAPEWMAVMAARVAQKGGSLETSRMIWSQIYESNQNPKVREWALQTLQGLKAEDDEKHLDEIADEYQRRFGRYPKSTSELHAAGMLEGIPVDPLGYAYVFGPDGKAQLDPESAVIIPAEPETPPTPGR